MPVLRAHNIPRLKTVLGLRTKFYATVTYGATTRQTRSLQREGNNHVAWNENIDVLWENLIFLFYLQLSL
jgi:hypothetical protein